MERGQSKQNHHDGFTGGDAHVQPEDQDSWDEIDAAGGARSPVAAWEQQEDEEEEGFVLPPPCRGRQQLHAMLRRQWLSKVCMYVGLLHTEFIKTQIPFFLTV
jgi:hypothetical protein